MENENAGKVNLTEKFPPVSTREWEEKIKEDLKGADYEKNLGWETHDGYRIRPYYRREDLGGIEYLETVPGQFPYLRGSGSTDNSWLIRQDILVRNTKSGTGNGSPGLPDAEAANREDNAENGGAEAANRDAEAANREALEILDRGVTSIGFDLSASDMHGENFIHTLLKDIPLEQVPVNFITEGNYAELLGSIQSYAGQHNIDPARITGSISLDPIGRLCSTGSFRKDMQADLAGLGECLSYARDHLPGFRIIQTGGNIFHDSGASVSQALAFTLAMGNEYLVRLTGMGFSLEEILPHMQFRLSIGSSYFMEIAKLRAARYLWSRILEAYPGDRQDPPAMFIDSITSHWNQTLYDPHVNMLRGTTASMSAILGGTDSLTVTPFDLPLKDPGLLSGRVSRNTQIILREESHLDKVIDPAAGSYYIESLTDTLITGAWKLFLQTEENGGFHQCLEGGFIQEQVKKTAAVRAGNLANRREMLLGTNQFPILDEKAGVPRKDDTPVGVLPEGQRIIEPLETFRGGRDFEQLRLKTENHSGKQPVVFIIPLGNLAMRRARAMFTMNFFACAGFRVIDNIGKFRTVREGTDAAYEAGADIVVLCSSDDEYPGMADELVSGAGQEGSARGMIPVIAGYPKKHMDSLKKAGIEHFIHVRSNVLKELKKYQELLGI